MENERLESNLRAFYSKRIAELRKEISRLEKLNDELSDTTEDRGHHLELHVDGVKAIE